MGDYYTNREKGRWSVGWTHFINTGSLKNINGIKNIKFLAYNTNSEKNNLTTNYLHSNGWTFLTMASWGAGFTHFMPYGNYILAYNAKTGEAGFFKLNNSGTGMDTILTIHGWAKGWTSFVDLYDGYFFAYNSGTGEMRYNSINTDNKGVPIGYNELGQCNWSLNWTHFVPFRDPDNSSKKCLVAYNALTGRVRLDDIQCTKTQYIYANVVDKYWNTGWTHLVPFTCTATIDFKRKVSAYMLLVSRTGFCQYVRLYGNRLENIDSAYPVPAWDNMLVFDNFGEWSAGYGSNAEFYSAPYILAYNNITGDFDIGMYRL
jgi:hypothetical protein